MTRRAMQWTYQMRTVIHLLRSATSLSLEDGCAVFNLIFATELGAAGYGDGIDHYRYRDEYNARNLAGRSKMWKAICATNITAEEQTTRSTLMDKIRNVVAALGLDATAVPAAAVRAAAVDNQVDDDDITEDEDDEPPVVKQQRKNGKAAASAPAGPTAALDNEDEDEITTTVATPTTSMPARKKRKTIASSAPRPSWTLEPEEAKGSYTVNEDYVSFHSNEMFRELGNGRYLPLEPGWPAAKKRKPSSPVTEPFVMPAQANTEESETLAAGDEAIANDNEGEQIAMITKKPVVTNATGFVPNSITLPYPRST